MGSREEALEAENERLVGEMASMKKKIVLALKKQQAELQARIKAAEQRAEAAEAAAMSSLPPDSTRSDVELSSCGRSDGDYSNGESTAESTSEVSRLQSDFSAEEITRLKNELSQFQELSKQKIEQEESSKRQLQESQQRIEELCMANERLESQLLSGAQQVSDAFNQIADLHEKLGNVSKERDALSLAYEKISAEHSRFSEELEKAREDATSKTMEMEEMIASHKATQEGQEAAMSHLMQQMLGMEAPANLEVKEPEATEEKRELVELQQKLQNSESSLEQVKQNNSLLAAEVAKLQTSCSRNHEKTDAEAFLVEITSLRESRSILEKELVDVKEKLSQLQSENQVKERDDKYVELDSKFNRLQKRAKQRIQELQKEKDEIEAQLSAAQEKEALATSKQASLQAELERFRAQAGDAIRALDAERQSLRNTNSKLKEETDELKRLLAAKEHNLEESRRLASEKDQTALRMLAEMEEAEERYAAAVYALKEQNKKELEVLQNQLADKKLETSKLSETILSLQALLVEKESKVTDLEAALTGEVARLSAAIESEKREAAQCQEELVNERRRWSDSLTVSETKTQRLESAYEQLERAFSESKKQLQNQLEAERQALEVAKREAASAKEEFTVLSKEFAAYKVRAHALLQKKDSELLAAKDTDLVAAQEAILKDAQRQAAAAVLEKDRAVSSLNRAVTDYETQLAARDVALVDAEQHIKDLATKLESVKGVLNCEREEWRIHSRELESSWQKKYAELFENQRQPAQEIIKNELSKFHTNYKNLQEEFDSFRDLANKMMEEKDQKIDKLLDDNDRLQKELQSQVQQRQEGIQQDSAAPVIAVAEQQILLLARQQAQREEELKQCQRQIQVLQDELSELEHENRLRSQQEAMLKNEFRNMERAAKRETVDMTYLKNVILKLLETGEVEALLPVVGTLLQFSPDEVKRCQDSYSR